MITGLTAGAFDLLHPGYVALFRYIKTDDYCNCNFLTVALHVDPSIERPEKNKPVNSVGDRTMVLLAMKYVDEVIPYDTEKDLKNLIATLVPDYLFIGGDHKNDKFTGSDLDIVKSCQTEAIFCPREHDYSTTVLRKKIYRDELQRIHAPVFK